MKKQCTIFIIVSLMLTACKEESSTPLSAEAQLAERGKKTYMGSCIACHNSDPHKDGPIGPAVFGSSKELLEARIMRAAYPEGYKPKRDTKAMAALPMLADQIDALTAFLNFAE